MVRKNQSLGFTLVEIILVIGMIGVILGGLIAVIDPAAQFRKGRDAQRKSDIRTIQQAVELYRADNGAYPEFGSDARGHTYGWARATGLDINRFGIIYLRETPEGPGVSGSCRSPVGNPYHGYAYAGIANVYTIFTNLENTEDQEVKAGKPEPPYKPSGSATWNEGDTTFSWTGGSCPGTYNYWVVSP